MNSFPLLVLAGLLGYALRRPDLATLLGGAYLVASLLCFGMYARDKSAARRKARRTPEATLLLVGLAGGWPGAVLAQQWLRHKSSKAAFRWRFHVTVALNLAALAGLLHVLA